MINLIFNSNFLQKHHLKFDQGYTLSVEKMLAKLYFDDQQLTIFFSTDRLFLS